MILLAVFEDSVTRFGAEIQRDLPETIAVNGEQHTLAWHPQWNMLGDFAEDLNLQSVLIDTSDKFRYALSWCRQLGPTDHAICFCDYELVGVSVTEADIFGVEELALALAKTTEVKEAVEFFNRSTQGLLIAAILAANKNADVDIWIATGIGTGVSDHVRLLRQHIRRGNSVDVAHQLTRRQHAAQPIESIHNAVKKYSTSRTIVDRGFWPEKANAWFGNNLTDSPVPHAFTSFSSVLRDNPANDLVHYLVQLGASSAQATAWLTEKGCFESLKHFLGACAIAQAGNRALTLGALVFPLLQATRPTEHQAWVSDLNWTIIYDEISDGVSRENARNLILSAASLFELLYKPHIQNDQNNRVKAAFVDRQDGKHLLIDFSFDCSIGDDSRKPSLSAKCLTFAQYPSSDVSGAVYNLIQACRAKDGNQKIFVSLYPVPDGGQVWTRLDFKAST